MQNYSSTVTEKYRSNEYNSKVDTGASLGQKQNLIFRVDTLYYLKYSSLKNIKEATKLKGMPIAGMAGMGDQ